jgi:endo-1,4-beta-xylanase
MKFAYDATDGTGIYVNYHGMECVGDFNGDGVVNMDDVWPLVNRWNLADGECEGAVCYEAIYDLNSDGIIDLADIMIVVSNWGPCS